MHWVNMKKNTVGFIFQSVLRFYAKMTNLAVSKIQDQWTLNFPSSHITFMRPLRNLSAKSQVTQYVRNFNLAHPGSNYLAKKPLHREKF